MAADPAPTGASAEEHPHAASTRAVVRAAARLLADAGIRLAGERVLAMCSGGLDSTCLVDVLASLPRGARPQSVTVLFMDHGLRDVEPDRAAARAVADRHRLTFVEVRAQGLAPGPNIQGRAREWRYEEAARQALARRCQVVATGHHADDQLETLLYALVSTSGLPAWAGIPVARPLEHHGSELLLVRPLLAATRNELREHAAERSLGHAEDPSNASLEFRRNRLRHEVVPQLLAIHPGAAMNIERSRRLLARQARAERELAAAVLAGAIDEAGGLDVRALGRLGAEARQSVIVAWLRGQGVGRALTSRIVRAVCELADARVRSHDDVAGRSARGRRRVAMPGACVVRDRYHLRVHPAGGASQGCADGTTPSG